MTRKKARILVMLFTVVCLLSVTSLCFAETPSILQCKKLVKDALYEYACGEISEDEFLEYILIYANNN